MDENEKKEFRKKQLKGAKIVDLINRLERRVKKFDEIGVYVHKASNGTEQNFHIINRERINAYILVLRDLEELFDIDILDEKLIQIERHAEFEYRYGRSVYKRNGTKEEFYPDIEEGELEDLEELEARLGVKIKD